ncbi:glycogen synthase GlgA [Orrella sp. JC864]
MVAAEAYPLAKTGGLGDAVTGMAVAMVEAGIDLQLLLPAYRGVSRKLAGVRTVARLADLPGGPARLLAGRCRETGLSVLLLANDALYDRHGLYVDENGQEYADNAERFAALSHAALRISQGVQAVPVPHLVHAHDWHAGLVPLLLHAHAVRGVKTVMTLHNLAFQGLFPMEKADAVGLPQAYRDESGAQAWGRINYLKAGIAYADRVTTVSRNYAREILTPAFGCGLDPLLAGRGEHLVAIANGIDDRTWDPARDPCLDGMHYSARDVRNKARCKQALQKAFGLAQQPDKVLLAMGNRLTHQKMADVAVQALPLALQAHPELQVVVIGEGERGYEAALRELGERFAGRCGVRIGYDEAAGHRLHAGADMLLHGSRFEPFGLTPLYAMRYGTIPIGSRVGGMADTIHDPGEHAPDEAMRAATGVLFEGDSVQAMVGAIGRAVRLHARAPLWRAMQRNGMTGEFGWTAAVQPYVRLFREMVGPLADEAVRVPALRPVARPALVKVRAIGRPDNRDVGVAAAA